MNLLERLQAADRLLLSIGESLADLGRPVQALHISDCLPETIAAAREAGARHRVARISSTPEGYVYDECTIELPGDGYRTAGLYGAARPGTAEELAEITAREVSP